MQSEGDFETTSRKPDEQWTRIAANLRAYREAQRRAWGEIKESMIARYLGGMSTEGECQRIEQAMRQFPHVRECVETIKEVMNARCQWTRILTQLVNPNCYAA
jgi:hypothetical protein